MVNIVDEDIMPIVCFLIKKAEFLKVEYEIPQDFIKQRIRNEQGEKPKRGIHKCL